MGVQVRAARSHADMRRFRLLPRSVYRTSEHRVAPLDIAEKRLFDRNRNPFHLEAAVEHFVALDHAGQCVGRVAATVHPGYVERHGPQAFFGFFEAHDDADVVSSLMEAAASWARERGMSSLVGPYSYTTSQDVGLLVEGFDQAPAFLQPYNPAYYERRLVACGFKRTKTLRTFRVDRSHDPAVTGNLERVSDALLRRHGLAVRSIDLSRYDEELAMLRRLYNRSFEGYPAAVPIRAPVFRAQAEDLKSILDGNLARIIEKDGVPIAFAVMVPNLNEILAGRDGRLSLDLILRWKALRQSIRSLVVVMIGALPEFMGAGLGRCLAFEIWKAIATGQYSQVHTTWVHEDNWASGSLMAKLKMKAGPAYGLFERRL